MEKLRAAITGIQGYVPDYVLTNAELATMVDTNDDWISTRTGIKERRILNKNGEGTSFLGVEAARILFEKTNTDPSEIDFVICSTITPDLVFPATANIISDKLGIKNAFSYDISAACSGFLYALTTGAKFVESGQYKKVLVISADKMSSIINYSDRNTCIIFGDGAGVALLEPTYEKVGVMDSILKSDGAGRNYLHQKAGGSVKPASFETITANEHFVWQDGKQVFKHAVSNMAQVSVDVMKRNGLTADDITWLVPHQANKRIIDATRDRMGIPEERVMMNIERYGNTTNATIPLCLWDWEDKLKKGDNLILSAFGGGFTWGAIYVKWAYNGAK